MSTWNKKEILKEDVERIKQKYNLDALTASIMVRRGITEGRDILYYLEDDLRFQHSPFSFNAMEDAVDRVLYAKEENEKVLIFGDRDVDGITATTVLYDALKSIGIDVQYKLPGKDDPYGLNMKAVDDFASQYGSLIITVDCGISNTEEIAHAASLGLDVIVMDHHNPPEKLPEPAIIIDAKTENSGYPFKDISGCAVVYKFVSALRFSESKWYKEEVALLNIQEDKEDDTATIDIIKVRNLIPVSRLSQKINGQTSVSETGIPSFLQGQIILVWDKALQDKLLKQTFGLGAEFNTLDIREEVIKFFPSMNGLPLSKIKTLSKIAKYGNHEPTEIGGFYNIFVTYVQKTIKNEFPEFSEQEEKDLQLVSLAALADIMPMKNENRIFVKKGLESINSGKVRSGLLNLMAELNLLGKRVSSTDLSWVVVSNLNAAGRMGNPEYAAELFLTSEQAFRDGIAKKIMELNSKRKQYSTEGFSYALTQAEESIKKHYGKLCFVIDEKININERNMWPVVVDSNDNIGSGYNPTKTKPLNKNKRFGYAYI